MTPDPKTVTALADQVMAEVHKDMRQPFPWGKQIPRNVGSFSHLHDYCDANEYLLALVPAPAPAEVREQDHRDFPHDTPCPNCGRRQWGLGSDVVDPMNPTDAEQETCGACGWSFNGNCTCGVGRGEPTLGGDHEDGCPEASDEAQAKRDLWHETLNAVSDEVDNRLAAEADLLSQQLVAGTITYPLDFGVIDGDLHEMWASLHKVAQEAMEGKTVTVVVTHPDEEAAEASRITMVEVHFGTDAAALDLAVNQEAFTAEIEKPGNAAHFARYPLAAEVCAGCGDYLHTGSDGRLYDTSGDPECWARSNNAHVARKEVTWA